MLLFGDYCLLGFEEPFVSISNTIIHSQNYKQVGDYVLSFLPFMLVLNYIIVVNIPHTYLYLSTEHNCFMTIHTFNAEPNKYTNNRTSSIPIVNIKYLFASSKYIHEII